MWFFSGWTNKVRPSFPPLLARAHPIGWDIPNLCSAWPRFPSINVNALSAPRPRLLTLASASGELQVELLCVVWRRKRVSSSLFPGSPSSNQPLEEPSTDASVGNFTSRSPGVVAPRCNRRPPDLSPGSSCRIYSCPEESRQAAAKKPWAARPVSPRASLLPPDSHSKSHPHRVRGRRKRLRRWSRVRPPPPPPLNLVSIGVQLVGRNNTTQVDPASLTWTLLALGWTSGLFRGGIRWLHWQRDWLERSGEIRDNKEDTEKEGTG